MSLLDVNMGERNSLKKDLFIATENNDIEKVKTVLSSKVNVNQRDALGRTPLILACEKGLYSMVKLLLENGCDVDAEDNNGNIALKAAHLNGKHDIEELLKEYELEKLLLVKAIEKGELEKVKSFIEKGINVNTKTIDPNFIRDYVMKDGYQIAKTIDFDAAKSIHSLLYTGAGHLSENLSKGFTPLLYAVRFGQIEISEYLIDSGADIDTTDSMGGSALMKASYYNNYVLLELLLENGANPNLQNENGKTALMKLIENGKHEKAQLPLITLLLRKDFYTNTNLTDNKGKKAIDYAFERGKKEIFRLLDI
jgi:serine/threonine-protein phosphatase 6 regulatory ankyrin repeat subunit B